MTEPCGKCGRDKPCGCGRPTDYDPAFIAKVDEYITQCKDTRQADGNTIVFKVKLPKREGFAKFIGKSVDALADWERLYPEFGGALRRIDAEQKERLIDSGLAGEYNSTIAKLVLSANHGMKEKSESEVTVKKDGAADLAASLLGQPKTSELKA